MAERDAAPARTISGFLAPAATASGELPLLPAVRTAPRAGEPKKRVHIPDSPVTPASRRCLHGPCPTPTGRRGAYY